MRCLAIVLVLATLLVGLANASQIDEVGKSSQHLLSIDRNSVRTLFADVIDFENPKFGHDVRFTQTQIIKGVSAAAKNWLKKEVGEAQAERMEQSILRGDDPYAYFRFLPTSVGAVVPFMNTSINIPGSCFTSISVEIVAADPAYHWVATQFLARGPQKDWLCSDILILSTLERLEILNIQKAEQPVVFNWTRSNPYDTDYAWDLKANGIRIHTLSEGLVQTIADVIATAALFESMDKPNITDATAKLNIDFLKYYARVDVGVRPDPSPVDDFAKYAQPGDFVGVMRLDGLDPMLAWAMGSTTGHTCVVLRDPDTGKMYVAESTTHSAFWPQNGIQITDIETWTKQAQAAGSSAIWVPLTDEARRNFDERKAWEYFKSIEGFDYGYNNFLYGWLDTATDNFPCLPPDFKRCLSRGNLELIFSVIEHIAEPFANKMFLQAFQKRAGLRNMPNLASILRAVAQRAPAGTDVFTTLFTAVEQDTWTYNTTRNGVVAEGPSRVCCAFVCSIWKASGVFNPFVYNTTRDINCAEQTNWDVYSLNIVQKSNPKLTPACEKANPGNPHCQFTGKYTLTLNDVGTRTPYQNMGEHCPTKGPFYPRVPGC